MTHEPQEGNYELERLYEQLDAAMDALREARSNPDDDAYFAARTRVTELRTQIYELENEQ